MEFEILEDIHVEWDFKTFDLKKGQIISLDDLQGYFDSSDLDEISEDMSMLFKYIRRVE